MLPVQMCTSLSRRYLHISHPLSEYSLELQHIPCHLSSVLLSLLDSLLLPSGYFLNLSSLLHQESPPSARHLKSTGPPSIPYKAFTKSYCKHLSASVARCWPPQGREHGFHLCTRRPSIWSALNNWFEKTKRNKTLREPGENILWIYSSNKQ